MDRPLSLHQEGGVQIVRNFSDVRLGRVFAVGALAFATSVLLVLAVITAYAFALGFQVRGQPDQAEIQRFAVRVAPWLGPGLALVFTLCGASWLARRVTHRRMLHGVLVGGLVGIFVFVADAIHGISLLDVGTLMAFVGAGYMGGVFGAARGGTPAAK